MSVGRLLEEQQALQFAGAKFRVASLRDVRHNHRPTDSPTRARLAPPWGGSGMWGVAGRLYDRDPATSGPCQVTTRVLHHRVRRSL